jgi:hypothetical protein
MLEENLSALNKPRCDFSCAPKGQVLVCIFQRNYFTEHKGNMLKIMNKRYVKRGNE